MSEALVELSGLFGNFRILCDVGRSMEPTNYPGFVCENAAEWSAFLVHNGMRYPILICGDCRKRTKRLVGDRRL